MAEASCNVTYYPESLEELDNGEIKNMSMMIECSHNAIYEATVSHKAVAKLLGNTFLVYENHPDLHIQNFTIEALAFGICTIDFDPYPDETDNHTNIPSYDVSVIRENSPWDVIALAIIGLFLILFNLGFGCTLRIDFLIAIIKKPAAPAVGFLTQLLVMAPVAFGIAFVFDVDEYAGLGLLVIGACPCGGASNIFAFLLGADLELSIILTATTMIGAIGTTPFWIWILGPYFTDDTRTTIPATDVLKILMFILAPLCLGLLINYRRPRWGERLAWCLKPCLAMFGFPVMIIASIAFWPVFERASRETIVASTVLPIAGYAIGFMVSYIIFRDKKKAVTISLGTGMQNMALALLILNVSLPSPESDLASVVPIAYSFLSGACQGIAVLAVLSYRYMRIGKCQLKDNTDKDGYKGIPGGGKLTSAEHNCQSDGYASFEESDASLGYTSFPDIEEIDTSNEKSPIICPQRSYQSNR